QKENVLPMRHACMSTEEGYFPQGAASRSWTKRKAEVPLGARQRKSGGRLCKTASSKQTVI
ncbi:hypothetical protein, partial [Parageobacillus toebii]|uniref:hypothetical protein n=1 Tax=Parageobacillus toebii TaxID=153151 RepID=UPI003D2977A1